MSFITYLGLIGLLGIVVLLLIYILKPNYQKKSVSSTYVWKLSLKYRKRGSVSKFRNILLIICQISIIVMCSVVLMQPFIRGAAQANVPERIIIIDASASMLAANEGDETRFERAVRQARIYGEEVITRQGGRVSVVLAGAKADYIRTAGGGRIFRTGDIGFLNAGLDNLIEDEWGRRELACTFGVADIDGAILLANEVLDINPSARIILYTATKFADTNEREYIVNGITVRDVSANEWNAAILHVKTVFRDNAFSFEVEVASFNLNMNMTVRFTAYSVNPRPGSDRVQVDLTENVILLQDTPRTVFFENCDSLIGVGNDYGRFFSFDRIRIWIEMNGTPVNDAFLEDNEIWIFGGQRETINIMYSSAFSEGHSHQGQASHNIFFRAFLNGLRRVMGHRWNINIVETHEPNRIELQGFDLYIFENVMPVLLPTDGVVLLISPDRTPSNLDGLQFGNWVVNSDWQSLEDNYVFSHGEEHPIMDYIRPDIMGVERFRSIVSYDESFTPLMFIGDAEDNNPVLLLKDEPDTKIVVMPFSLNNANLAVVPDFSFILQNIFAHFFPPTITKHIFYVGQEIVLNSRGPDLTLEGQGYEEVFEVFDGVNNFFSVSRPGEYILEQLPFGRIETVKEYFFVRIPTQESNFARLGIFTPPIFPERGLVNLELLIYFAAVLLALWFFERLLHIRGDQF